jgi:hypothetical protein
MHVDTRKPGLHPGSLVKNTLQFNANSILAEIGSRFVASEYQAISGRETFKYTVTLTLPRGLVIKKVQIHEREGKRWIWFAGIPYETREGMKSYSKILDVATPAAKAKFTALALDAADRLLGEARAS